MKRLILIAVLAGALAALLAGTALAAGPVTPPAQGFGPGHGDPHAGHRHDDVRHGHGARWHERAAEHLHGQGSRKRWRAAGHDRRGYPGQAVGRRVAGADRGGQDSPCR